MCTFVLDDYLSILVTDFYIYLLVLFKAVMTNHRLARFQLPFFPNLGRHFPSLGR